MVLAGLVLPGTARLQAQPSCPPIDTTAAWVRARKAWGNETGATWTHDALRRQLLELGEEDQRARADFGARLGDTAYVRSLLRGDSTRSRRLAAILDQYGMPTRAMVGARGVDAMMLVVQHSATLQERVLALAESLPAGSVSPEALALLEDRVRIGKGRPQRYGSQFTAGPDGVFRFAPVEDPAGLEARRAAAGLPPMPFYLCTMEQSGMRVDRSTLPPPPS